jgi:hypothetical protein
MMMVENTAQQRPSQFALFTKYYGEKKKAMAGHGTSVAAMRNTIKPTILVKRPRVLPFGTWLIFKLQTVLCKVTTEAEENVVIKVAEETVEHPA